MGNLKKFYELFQPIWDGYEIGQLLGSGSFGDVYELREQGNVLAADEAVKEILVPPLSAGGMSEAFFQGLDIEGAKYYYEEMLQKALEEVKILQKLSVYPNMVGIKEYKIFELPDGLDEYGWVVFVRMERLCPLKDRFIRDGMTVLDTVNMIIDLCKALEACCTEGILHQDIKPENIFYSPVTKQYKLGDFGIACYIGQATEQKGLPGTLTHMAPEIYRGGVFDYEADLYAVGMILYKILNENRIPFLPDYPRKYTPNLRNVAIKKRLEGACIPLPSVARKGSKSDLLLLNVGVISPEGIYQLAEIARKSIANDRTRRYRSATELKIVLENWREKYTSIRR